MLVENETTQTTDSEAQQRAIDCALEDQRREALLGIACRFIDGRQATVELVDLVESRYLHAVEWRQSPDQLMGDLQAMTAQ